MNMRNSLLDSAESIVRKRGLNAFSYADLSRELDLRKASIHYHFPKKSDLVLEVLKRYSSRFLSQLDDIMIKNETAASQLDAYIQAYRSALGGGESVCLCVVVSADTLTINNEAVITHLRAFQASSLSWLQAVFERARKDSSIQGVDNPHLESFATFALVEGAQLMVRASGNASLFDKATQTLRQRFQIGETECI